MKRSVRIEPTAQLELEEAARRYEEQKPDAGLGSALFEAAAAAKRLLAAGHHGTPVLSAQTSARRLQLNRFPYWVVFIERADVVLIIAFAHQKRRPYYWRRRLPP